MKNQPTKEAIKLLKQAGCSIKQTGGHTIWVAPSGRIFSLPCHHKTISPGVAKKLRIFLEQINI